MFDAILTPLDEHIQFERAVCRRVIVFCISLACIIGAHAYFEPENWIILILAESVGMTGIAGAFGFLASKKQSEIGDDYD